MGRSGKAIQKRLARFAETGDFASAQGLANLSQQTAVELMREKDAIRYATSESHGPLSMTNGETKMNAEALSERSRFQVERLRGGKHGPKKSDSDEIVGDEALEFVVVTLIVATNTRIAGLEKFGGASDLERVLTNLGGISPDALLGLEVIWTPADPDDSMTETDVMVTYPNLTKL